MAFEAISNTLGTYQEIPSTAKNVTTKSVEPVDRVVQDSAVIMQNAVMKTNNEENAGAGAGNTDEQRQASEEAVKSALSKANSQLHRTRCEFSYHEETKRVSIKVYDKDTQKIIREIPPEESLDMIQKMWDLAGLIVDEKR